MTVVVFSGPSLPRGEVDRLEGFVWQPPLRQGDFYHAARDYPAAIGIVDGIFETTPTVWHKEILWALSEGIPVYGAASIGALRAVELAAFGMRGTGRVFEMFRDGAHEDDDEIAVLHAPSEFGYVPVTEAMVNVRATVARAMGEGALPLGHAEQIIEAAKALFYKERTWETIFSKIGRDAATDAFEAWLPNHRVDQKRLDALAMLARLQADLNEGVAPPPTSFPFAHTVAWQAVVDSVERLLD